MQKSRTSQGPQKAEQQTREPPRGKMDAQVLPEWNRDLDLRHHPPLNMAPVEPIDWSRYVASRMNAYETGW